MNRLTHSQIRAARGMLNWSMIDLAKAAGLSVSTVRRMEMAEPQTVPSAAYENVKDALEKVRVRFLFDSGKGEGVWFDHG